MRNKIPAINDLVNDIPYCIWHPEIATEATYRQLVRQYPHMCYEVGRACAVAGYTELYRELVAVYDLLPEVHIAEEAREAGSLEIFNDIMAKKPRYEVMNDYQRTVNTETPEAAHLNGDTAVRSYLEVKVKFDKELISKPYFNITEDMNVDNEWTGSPPDLLEDSTLLYTPLPQDLPTAQKDLLILMAAYYGDIDRYVRLRRPVMIEEESKCVVRGIYHNSMFAKWWSLQQTDNFDIRGAINARRIMTNDLSFLDDNPNASIARVIWYPRRARPETYQELAERRPDTKRFAARACIVANYQELFDKLDAEPSESLLFEAKASKNDHYLRQLECKLEKRGGKLLDEYFLPALQYSGPHLVEPASHKPSDYGEIVEPIPTLCARHVGTLSPFLYGSNIGPDVSIVEHFVFFANKLQ